MTAHAAVPSAITRAMPTLFLRVEGLAVFVASLLAYGWTHTHHAGALGWWSFLAGFLVPDLAMLGYLRSPRVGAIAYNLAHTETLAAAVIGAAIWSGSGTLLSIGVLWLAHIGFDRMAGYGLKYPEAFNLTHLGTIGRQRPASGTRAAA